MFSQIEEEVMSNVILMRPVTAAEVAATAAHRFREQYSDWDARDKFADGKTKDDVDTVFNTQPHTPANVAAILNEGWAYPQCACCNGYFNTVVRIRKPWGDEEFDLCAGCIELAARTLTSGLDTSQAAK